MPNVRGKRAVRYVLFDSNYWKSFVYARLDVRPDLFAEVHADDAVYIPPDAKQYIQNTGESDLIFLCIVDPAWQAEDEEVL